MLKRFSIFLGFILGVAGLLAIFGTPVDLLNKIPNHYSAIAVVVLIALVLSLFFGDKIDPEIGGSRPLSRRITVGSSRTKINYASTISEAKSQVTVIGLSLPSFAGEAVTDAIRNLATSGVSIRIIVANPCSSTFSLRRSEMYNNKTDAADACRNTLSALASVWNELDDVGKFNLEVYAQHRPPTVGIVKVDDKVLWSPVLLATTGALSPFLVVSAAEPVFGEALARHINETLVYHTQRLDLSRAIEKQCEDALIQPPIGPGKVQEVNA